ncbi:MAG: hypothetical protein ABSF44_03995 [Candidatus Bathyarchaeia archaeon]|jgi:hypothetical protein
MIHSRAKPFNRLINNRKGYAGIISAIFLVLVILFLFFNVYTFYNNRNTAYQDTVGQVAQMAADRSTELATLSIVKPAAFPGNNIVYISCSIEDNGPIPSQIVRLWVKDLTNSAVGNSASSIVLQPGSITKYFNSVNIPNVSSSDQFTFWFLTARGNTIAASPSTTQMVNKGPSNSNGLDGEASTYSSISSLTLSLTTTKANDLVYVAAIFDDSDKATTPRSTPSLTWSQRALSTGTGNAGGDAVLETWYAIMPSSGTISITDSLSSPQDVFDYNWAVVALAVSGVNTRSPFDGPPQTSVKSSRGTGTTANVLTTTTNANDFVIGAVEVDNQNPTVTPGAGFTQVLPVQSAFDNTSPEDQGRSVWTEYCNPTRPLTSLSVNCAFDGNYAWAIVADAVKLSSSAITLSAVSGPTGDTIGVSGSGFAANSLLSATFSGSPISLSGSAATDVSGNIPPGTTFIIPAGSTAGDKTVTIVDGASNSAFATFTVMTSSITLSPASGPVGTLVTVTGSNFISYSNIPINFDGSPIATDPSYVTTNAAGGFKATFNVSSDTAGEKTVLTTDWVNFANINFAIIPSISVIPIRGLNNTSVTLSGEGFAAKSNIMVQFAGATVSTSPQNVATDSTGSFSGAKFIAQSSTGHKIVNVTDSSGNSGSTTFNLVALDHFAISVPSSETAGSGFDGVTVTAYDADNNVINDYTGQIYFTSSDSKAALPFTLTNVYVFTTADNGTHVFSGFTLYTARSQTLTATDGNISNTSSAITVSPSSASILVVSGFPNPVLSGSAGNITVVAKDQYNNTATGYRGVMHFTSSDAAAVLPSNYTFQLSDNGVHTFSNGVTLNTIGVQSITATDTPSSSISGSQTNITVNPPWGALTVSDSPNAIDRGQTSSLTSNAVTTGTSPYSYQWLQKAPNAGSYSSISGATSSSYSFVTSGSTTIGPWSFELQVTDSNGGCINSSALVVNVNSAPTVSVSPASWTMDIGQSETLTATAGGGSGTYTDYQWFVNGSARSIGTSSTFNFVASSFGSYLITVAVTDSLGGTSSLSSPATVNVNASPTVGIAPLGPLTMDVGQVQTFTATVSGGSGSPSYQWYLDGSAVGTNSPNYSYSAAGTSHSVACKVTDSAPTPIASPVSNIVTIMVSASPTVSIAPAGSFTMDAGQTLQYTAASVGGSGTIHYQWYVGSATVGTDSSSYTYTASGASASITCKVTDSASTPVTSLASNVVSVTVNSALVAPAASASKSTVDQGQTASLTSIAVSTGTSPYSYQWFSEAPSAVSYLSISGAISSTYSFVTSSSTATGTWSFELKVTDSAGAPAVVTSAAVSIVVNSGPSVSITPSSWTIDVGQSETLTANPTGGSGTYSSYVWYVDSTLQSGQTTSTFSYSPSSAGSPSITVTVSDSLGGFSSQSAAPSVTVNSAPTVSVSPSSLAMDVGQSETFTASASGGSGSLSYQWYLDGSAVSGQTGISYSFTTSSAGSPTIYCKVTDSASTPFTVQSNTPLVTVAALPTVSVAAVGPFTLDVGQVQTFTATVSGGSGAIHYQWYLSGSVVSGATASTHSFSGSVGSYSVTCMVTDSASMPVTSPASNAVTITVAASPTVSIAPVGPLTMDAGQVQIFTATASGGTGTLSYQWYLAGSAVSGANSASYSYTAAGTSHSITCKVTDSASTPVTSASNAVSVTVNSALVAPTASASPVTVNLGQTVHLTSTAVSTGSGGYTYKWMISSGGAYSAISGATTAAFDYVTTATGSFTFKLVVTDLTNAQVTSAATASVTVK